jgi:Phage Tail Collar Domain
VPPAGWLICDGQSYPTATYPNLFSVIGYSYGGSGAVFSVPDCRARVTVGAGVSPGLTNRSLTTKGGEENHILSPSEMPIHNHAVNDPGHFHGITDNGHAHSVFDPQHAHGLSDPGHVHGVVDNGHAHSVFDPGHKHIAFFSTNSDSGLPQPGRDSVPPYGYTSAVDDYQVQYGHSSIWLMQAYTSTEATGVGIFPSGTGIGIARAATGMGVFGAPTNISIYPNGTGITVNPKVTGITTANLGATSGITISNPISRLTKSFTCKWLPTIRPIFIRRSKWKPLTSRWGTCLPSTCRIRKEKRLGGNIPYSKSISGKRLSTRILSKFLPRLLSP